MKKILSAALAAAMVVSMAVTSFAALKFDVMRPVVGATQPSDLTLVAPDSPSTPLDFVPVVGGVVQGYEFDYVINSNSIEQNTDKFAFAVPLDVSGIASNDLKKEMAKVKVKADWLGGTGKGVSSVKIEYLKNNNGTVAGANPTSDDYYSYYLVVRFDDTVSTSTIQAAGILTLYTSSPNSGEEYHIDFTRVRTGRTKSIGPEADYAGNETITVADGQPGGAPRRTFRQGTQEAALIFDTVGEFHANFEDQGALYLGFTFDENRDLIGKYDHIDHEYVNFPGKPKFNKTGLFYLYAEPEQYVYMVRDGVVEEIDAVYDEEYDAYKFALRNFPDSFIIADEELEITPVEDVETEEPAPEIEEPENKPNPPTGR